MSEHSSPAARLRAKAGTVLDQIKARLGVDVDVRLRALPKSSSDDSLPFDATVAPSTDALAYDETVAPPSDALRGAAFDETAAPDSADRSALAAAVELPQRSDRLRFGRVIGRGGMGTVRLAEDTDLRRDLAAKIVEIPSEANEAAAITRFVEEAQITAQLEHPGIVPVHELGVDPDGNVFFTMKLVRGLSLGEILRARAAGDPTVRRRYGLRRLIRIFAQLTGAVEYAHDRGVIHRDLKPDNIMVGAYGEVLVMDWGLAKVVGSTSLDPEPGTSGRDISTVRTDDDLDQTLYGAVVGTPYYMAPEQGRGDQNALGPHTDIYSLGVILYQILCGEVPFRGESTDAVLEAHRSLDPQPPSQRQIGRVPVALETLCLAMLEKDPKRREVTLPQARAAIQDYLEGIAPEVREERLIRRGARLALAVLAFAFTTWYLGVGTRQLFRPQALLNGLGWFLLLLHVMVSLKGLATAFPVLGRRPLPFAPQRWDEAYTGAMMAAARKATSIAPLFQLSALTQLATWFSVVVLNCDTNPSPGAAELLREGCQHALMVPMLFLGAWFYLQYEEVRFARSVDRYNALIRRRRWETGWPILLTVLAVGVVMANTFGAWALEHSYPDLPAFLDDAMGTPVDVFNVAKSMVANSTFLAIGLAVLLALQFPLAEILAAMRLNQLGADQGDVEERAHYYLRSLAVAHVARMSCLYGGAAVSTITALNALSGNVSGGPFEVGILLLGPTVLGMVGYALLGGALRRYLANNPTVREVLTDVLEHDESMAHAARLRVAADDRVPSRLIAIGVAFAPLLLFALWSAASESSDLQTFVEKVPELDWIMPVPYVLLGLALVFRDRLFQRYTV